MMDLHKFFINPFNAADISMDELLAFTTDHLQKMTANNPGGVFTGRLVATNTALTGVGNAFTDDQTKLGLRKARKQAKDAFRSALAKKISPLAVGVEAKFGEGAPEFTECFPQGRKIFSDCTDDKVANHLQTLINGVTAHQAQLGAQLVTDAMALLTGWNAVYAPSESSTGAKTTTETAKAAARAALQLELFKNLLTLALNFAGQPEKLDDYMEFPMVLNMNHYLNGYDGIPNKLSEESNPSYF